MPGASSAGPPNPVNQFFPTPHSPPPTIFFVGVNISAKAFATLPLGYIRASGAIENLRLQRATENNGPSGFVKPFVTVEYRYN